MSLQLSKTFSLPKEASLWAFVILAIRGAGKSYDAAKMAEEMLKLGVPIVVFDPMGIWWGLRVGVTGEGLPVVIFGGRHGDLPMPTTVGKNKREIIDEPKMRLMVNSILKAGLSVVLDTSELSITQQTRAVAIFGDELFRKNSDYGVRHVFIEEADVYCPQKPQGESQESHTAIDNLVRRGGNYNLGVTMITQRAAVLDKNVLSQANCLIAMRLMWDPDKKTVETWVKSKVSNEREIVKLAKWYDSLKDLKNGEAWVYSPEHDIFERVQFGERETLHASREFFLKATWEQKNITLLDVRKFVVDFIQTGDKINAAKKREQSQLADERAVTPNVSLKEQTVTSPGRPAREATILDPWKSSSGTTTPLPPPILSIKPGDRIYPEDVKQSLPTLSIHQFKPTLEVPVELQEPTTTVGRLAVLIYNGSGQSKQESRWTKTLFATRLKEHGWSSEGLNEAIDQLLRWEILKSANNYLYASRDRVKVVNEGIGVRLN
jgi:hypothetical protein